MYPFETFHEKQMNYCKENVYKNMYFICDFYFILIPKFGKERKVEVALVEKRSLNTRDWCLNGPLTPTSRAMASIPKPPFY